MANLIAKYEPKPREWYENPPVIYGFNIPKVRARLEWLMGTHIVQALDRGYQRMLQEVMQEDFATNVKKRNQDRQKEEINREKQLVLEGKMSLDEAPKGIAKNPVLKINAKIEAIKKKQKNKLKKYHSLAVFDYDYTAIRLLLEMRGVQTTGYGETKCNVSSCYKIQDIRNDADDPEKHYLLTPEEYAHLRPEEPDITQLNEMKGVAEMYKKADFILGYEAEREVTISEDYKIDDENVADG